MRYFFPGVKDKKKQQKYKEDFMLDMKFDLTKGSIAKTTLKLNSKKHLVSGHIKLSFRLGWNNEDFGEARWQKLVKWTGSTRADAIDLWLCIC